MRAVLAGLAMDGAVSVGRSGSLRLAEAAGPRPRPQKGGAEARLSLAPGSAAMLLSPPAHSRSPGSGPHRHTVRKRMIRQWPARTVWEAGRARRPRGGESSSPPGVINHRVCPHGFLGDRKAERVAASGCFLLRMRFTLLTQVLESRSAKARSHKPCAAKSNPDGIVSLSPELRGTSYPGKPRPKVTNPNGVAAASVESTRSPLHSVRAIQGQPALQQAAAANGTDGLTLADIAAARRARHRK